jgi:hypothetical protein
VLTTSNYPSSPEQPRQSFFGIVDEPIMLTTDSFGIHLRGPRGGRLRFPLVESVETILDNIRKAPLALLLNVDRNVGLRKAIARNAPHPAAFWPKATTYFCWKLCKLQVPHAGNVQDTISPSSNVRDRVPYSLDQFCCRQYRQYESYLLAGLVPEELHCYQATKPAPEESGSTKAFFAYTPPSINRLKLIIAEQGD